jgi:tripartite-type tricarboxylate transporter receptor subunit TctC
VFIQISTAIKGKMNRLQAALLSLLLTVASQLTFAQNYPNKPIRLIVPFPVGGGTDIFARTVGQALTDTYKWTVVPDNKPGAGGNLGIDAVAKSPADGYTIGLGQTSNLAINPTLYAKLPYNPVKDLTPVVLLASAPLVIVVPENSPYKTFAEIAAAAKSKPGQITYGSPGNGTVAHLAMELLQKSAGIKFQHIPYKGSSQALTDLMGGQIQIFASSIPTALSQIKDGRLRAIAVTSLTRSPSLPNSPTIAESGVKGFEAITWFGFVVPAGTPSIIVQELNKNINQVLKQPEVKAKLMSDGGDVIGGTSEQFSSLLNKDLIRWGKVVKDSGTKLD